LLLSILVTRLKLPKLFFRLTSGSPLGRKTHRAGAPVRWRSSKCSALVRTGAPEYFQRSKSKKNQSDRRCGQNSKIYPWWTI